MRKYIPSIVLIIVDTILIFGLFAISDILYGNLFLAILFILFFFAFEGLYIQRYDFWRETQLIIKALLYSFMSIVLIDTLILNGDNNLISIGGYFILLGFVLPMIKRLVKKLLFYTNIFKQKCNIISKNSSDILKNELVDNWYLGLLPVSEQSDTIFIVSDGFESDELTTLINGYISSTKNIYLVPYLYQYDFSDSKNVNYFNIRLSAFHLENKLLSLKNIAIKSLFERLIVLLLLPLVSILHIIIYIAIKRDSKGDVIFKQKRIGKNGQTFSCYKYRTMYIDQDELLDSYLELHPDEIEYYGKYHKYKNDPRITNIGRILRKTSLDELPQFINILKFEMNLIGPRPYLADEIKKFPQGASDAIFSVHPGITGLWQVSGRSNISFSDRVKMDIWYTQNWSLWVDFVIFLKTIKVVLFRVGAK